MNSLAKTWVGDWIEGLGRITLLAKESVASLFRFRVAWRDLLYQVHFMGVKSQSVVLVKCSLNELTGHDEHTRLRNNGDGLRLS